MTELRLPVQPVVQSRTLPPHHSAIRRTRRRMSPREYLRGRPPLHRSVPTSATPDSGMTTPLGAAPAPHAPPVSSLHNQSKNHNSNIHNSFRIRSAQFSELSARGHSQERTLDVVMRKGYWESFRTSSTFRHQDQMPGNQSTYRATRNTRHPRMVTRHKLRVREFGSVPVRISVYRTSFRSST